MFGGVGGDELRTERIRDREEREIEGTGAEKR